MSNRVDVAVMIGSGVPKGLRAAGQKACWVVLVNGEQRGTAFSSRLEAEECRTAWMAQLSATQCAMHVRAQRA
ncbi:MULTISPECIES: hypothetical protein [Pseudomonas]|jgi:hypothetical protein|uniref:Uncharacterized protein n=1 Tax=Pseudomonas psychrophila TaxID=122355 RepID=A0A8I1K9K1_9PSED|nr:MULTISPECIES: hypothetical protein [Pseudomonas]EPJ91303.1 hypothetical protein CF149_22523 [Pseudomonas psychrophila]KAB0489504.1 hypothetical protein F7Q95_14640 [Pseudomonas psychrophila]KMM98811.1 hypothetical protein TU76_15175 [Pseudomonas psychrophila]KOX65137.1 hypothetical protein AA303_10550 [Pseudomonas psychrophila]MBJ2258465.1 hypothetical protein [Pseudomonas psychrophila]